jgi:hypothetical protein
VVDVQRFTTAASVAVERAAAVSAAVVRRRGAEARSQLDAPPGATALGRHGAFVPS